jgi:glycopeptide antibiotics resistance protein
MTWLVRHARVLLAIYSVLLVVALLLPSSTRQSAMVSWLQDVLTGAGLSGSVVTYARLEVVMNVLIVAPVSLLGSMWRPAYSWRDWTALGFCAALLVEAAQGLLLPDRQASFSDVVANTAGALLGAVVFRLLGSPGPRRRR